MSKGKIERAVVTVLVTGALNVTNLNLTAVGWALDELSNPTRIQEELREIPTVAVPSVTDDSGDESEVEEIVSVGEDVLGEGISTISKILDETSEPDEPRRESTKEDSVNDSREERNDTTTSVNVSTSSSSSAARANEKEEVSSKQVSDPVTSSNTKEVVTDLVTDDEKTVSPKSDETSVTETGDSNESVSEPVKELELVVARLVENFVRQAAPQSLDTGKPTRASEPYPKMVRNVEPWKEMEVLFSDTSSSKLASWGYLWQAMSRRQLKREMRQRKFLLSLRRGKGDGLTYLVTLRIPALKGVSFRVKQVFEMTPEELEKLAAILGIPPDQVGSLIGKLLEMLAQIEGVDLRTLTQIPVLITLLTSEGSTSLFSGGVTEEGWLFGVNQGFIEAIERLRTERAEELKARYGTQSDKVVSALGQTLFLTGLGYSLLPPEVTKQNDAGEQISLLARGLLKDLTQNSGLAMTEDELWPMLASIAPPQKIATPSKTLILESKPKTKTIDSATIPEADELPRIKERTNALAGKIIEAGQLVEAGLAVKDRGFAANEREAAFRKAKSLLRTSHPELQALKVHVLPQELEKRITELQKSETTIDFLIDQTGRRGRAEQAAREVRKALAKTFESQSPQESQAQLHAAHLAQEALQSELNDLINQPQWMREALPDGLTEATVHTFSLLRNEMNRLVTEFERQSARQETAFRAGRRPQADDFDTRPLAPPSIDQPALQ